MKNERGDFVRKEIIADHQSIVLVATFIFGSTLILGTGGDAKQDAWLAILVAIPMVIPALFVYARLLSLYPGKDLFDILNRVFGSFIGKFIALFFIWYAFHLGALVIRNFSEFMEIAAMPETPPMVIIFSMGLVCILALKDGIELLARLATFLLPFILLLIIIVVPLSLTQAHPENLKPILYEGWKPVIKGAFSTFSFPFGETIIFTMVLSTLKTKKSPYKSFYFALVISIIIMLIITLRNIMVLGHMASMVYFPSYIAVSVINIGDFLQRIEVTVAVIFLFAGFIKISVCLYAACNGITKIFNLGDYRRFVAPIGLFMLICADNIYENTMEMLEWIKYYPYYVIPFQIILPIIILIGAEIKVRKDRGQGTGDKEQGTEIKER